MSSGALSPISAGQLGRSADESTVSGREGDGAVTSEGEDAAGGGNGVKMSSGGEGGETDGNR
jgi:hypothetical protein